jgi:hypothetical protein
MKKVKGFFHSLYLKTEGISFIGFAIVIIGALMWRLLFNNPMPDLYLNVLICIALLFPVVGAINIIKYKEMPRVGFSNTTGFWAVFWGVLSLTISIVTIIILISEIISEGA